ncbi:MAG: TRAP transporter substrate-binding protein [Elioraea sp.]|nr:TRAP transporter substrate-binding protein [Elioraea sp.]MCX7961844.1 TRAP transporter substrate-binding protein [Burkholderiales bacterium]
MKTRFVAPCMLAAAGLSFGAAAPAAAQMTLTFSTWVPTTHHLSVWQENWTKEVEKATNGRIRFNYLPKHPSAPAGTFDAVRDGLMDLSYVTASYTPARHTLPLIAELPGAGATAEINSVAYSRIHWKHLHKAGEYNGVKLLAVWTHGPGHMFNTKRAINSLADLKGMKIRTGGGIAEKFGNLLGASAFVKPAPESYELLASGVADGVFFPLESVVSFKLDKLLKHATIFPGGFYSSAFGFFMNQNTWNRIPKQDQDIIERLAGEAAARSCGQSWDRADQAGLEALRKAAVRIDNASPEFVAEVMGRARQLEEEWIRAANAKGIDGAKVLAEFREELKRVAAGR